MDEPEGVFLWAGCVPSARGEGGIFFYQLLDPCEASTGCISEVMRLIYFLPTLKSNKRGDIEKVASLEACVLVALWPRLPQTYQEVYQGNSFQAWWLPTCLPSQRPFSLRYTLIHSFIHNRLLSSLPLGPSCR